MAEETTGPITQGVHHVGLTVPDVAATAAFFTGTLGMSEVGQRPDYPAIFVSDGKVMITLWQAEDPSAATPFDRRANIGLHHLALAVADRTALGDLHARLGQMGDVEIEFAPEPVGSIPFDHMMCRVPGGIRMEFIAPNRAVR